MNDALDEIVYVKEVMKEIMGKKAEDIPMELFTDSKNLHCSVMGTSLAENPRMRTEVAKLQESLKSGEIMKIVHLPGLEMIADCLTKRGASAEKLINILKRCKQ